MNFDILLELNKFNHIKYFDEPHQYFFDGRELTSATKFIGKFKPKFDTQTIAEEYAQKRGLKTEDVISDWDYKRDFSTVKGSAIHKYAEDYWGNKVFPYDASIAIKKFGIDSVKDPYNKCRELFLQFYNHAKENLVPVKMELVVGDIDLNIAGMVDCLFYNKKSDILEIYDYKTNKAIKTKDDFGNKFAKPISHLDVCEMNTYSLQLSLYKYIIEKNTNLQIGNMYLVWINEVNDKYKIIPCKDMKAEIITMIDYHK